jgi:hypothetical protein
MTDVLQSYVTTFRIVCSLPSFSCIVLFLDIVLSRYAAEMFSDGYEMVPILVVALFGT